MSLIQDQQRDNSGVETPEIKPIKVFSPPESPTTPPNIGEAQPTIDPAQAIPQENSLQGWDNINGKWQPESEFPDAVANLSDPRNSLESTSRVEKPAVVGFTGGDKLPEQLNLPGMPDPAPKFTPAPLPSLFTDTRQQGLGVNFSQPILGNSVPTIYASPPEIGLGGQIGNQLFTRANTLAAQQQAEQLAQANRQAASLERRNTSPNTPNVDKPWQQMVGGIFGDILLGTPEAQKKADQGQWNLDPTKGSFTFGRQGAGIGGFLKYGLGLIPNVIGGLESEITKGVANGLERLGLSREAAEKFARDKYLGFLPDKVGAIEFSRLKPSNIIGYNWEQARKKNQIIEALRGETILDLNDPKESTEITGRVFYSPRRRLTDKRDEQGRRLYQPWYEDPLGASIDILAQVFTLDPIGDAAGRILTTQAMRVLRPVTTKVAPIAQEALSNVKKTVNNLRTPISTPTTSVRIGTTKVTQASVQPKVNIGVLSETNPTPTHVVSKVGIGTPSSNPIVQIPELSVRSYQEALTNIDKKYPGVLTDYKGKTWNELKEHVANTAPNVDFSEYSAIGQKLTPEIPPNPAKLTYDDLLTANEELVAHKVNIQTQLEQLDEIFDDTVDFGRRPLQALEPRTTNAEDVLSVLENGGKPNLFPKALDNLVNTGKLQPEVASALRYGDFDRLVRLTERTGDNLNRVITEAVQENNRIISTPALVNRTLKPTEALTQLPQDLYHGTAISNWTPSYNLSLSGSRGELGSGLYLTKDAEVATQYAKARMGENANPATLDLNIDEPGVYKLTSELTSTLDARVKLSKETIDQLISVLPSELRAPLKKSLSRGDNTYSGFLSKLEASLPKANLEPTEDTLQFTQELVTGRLRELGYDSVYDAKSGFALVLDNSKLKLVEKTPVTQPSYLEAALARYNADAYSAKFFPQRLTTNANLQDSSAKLLEQLSQDVDDKLAEVQDKILKRLGNEDIEGILPKLSEASNTASKPRSVQEALDELEPPSICNP